MAKDIPALNPLVWAVQLENVTCTAQVEELHAEGVYTLQIQVQTLSARLGQDLHNSFCPKRDRPVVRNAAPSPATRAAPARWLPSEAVTHRQELVPIIGGHCAALRVQALVALLSRTCRLSHHRVQRLMADLCGLQLSLETPSTLEGDTTRALARAYQEVAPVVTAAPVADR